MGTVITTNSRYSGGSPKREILPPPPESDCMYFAYKLGYLSQTNIQHEARKPEPQLCRLVGHASLFDSARKYIQDHTADEFEDEDDATEVEQTLINQNSDDEDFSVSYVEDIDQESTIIDLMSSSTEVSLQDLLLQQKEGCGGSKTTQTLTIPKTKPRITWEEESDSSTESGDEIIDDGYWSDSTYPDENLDLQYLNVENFDFPSGQLAGLCSQNYTTANDDSIIWSQQPRIWSVRQVEDLFAQTFG